MSSSLIALRNYVSGDKVLMVNRVILHMHNAIVPFTISVQRLLFCKNLCLNHSFLKSPYTILFLCL